MAIIKKHTILAVAALALSACSNDIASDAPNTEKAAVSVAVSFADAESNANTRAVDHDFETNDKLIARLRHVVKNAEDATVVDEVAGFSKTVTFTVGNNPDMTLVDGTTATYQTSNIIADPKLYWDDFGNAEAPNGVEGENDIRTANHGLQSEWGWCFNGNRAAATSANASDVLTAWSVAPNQTAGIKTDDLLWSKTQSLVAYSHGNFGNNPSHGTLVIPYTHAMSKATVVLTAADGFGDNPFENTTVTLNDANIKGTFTASTATVVGDQGAGAYTTGNIEMHRFVLSADRKTVTFECVFVPNTTLATDRLWLTVNDVEGNKYEVRLSDAIREKWGNGPTESGVNYKLVATLKQQEIDVVAQLANWTTHEASGVAEIKFDTDLTNITVVDPKDDVPAGTSYDVFRGTTTANLAKATTERYDGTLWQNEPPIYWANASTNYYFRGLAKLENAKLVSVDGDNAATKEVDLLWATTPKHTGLDAANATVTVEEGAAVSPRTSNVPLRFEHAMSQIKFVLKTTTDDSRVDLTDATIQIPSLSDAGTIDVATGAIAPTATTSDLTTVSNKTHIVIPQTITDKVIIITLADGTKYKYTLSAEWLRGNSYTYEITLAKEQITLSAFVKKWVEKKGSGDASLDWD